MQCTRHVLSSTMHTVFHIHIWSFHNFVVQYCALYTYIFPSIVTSSGRLFLLNHCRTFSTCTKSIWGPLLLCHVRSKGRPQTLTWLGWAECKADDVTLCIAIKNVIWEFRCELWTHFLKNCNLLYSMNTIIKQMKQTNKNVWMKINEERHIRWISLSMSTAHCAITVYCDSQMHYLRNIWGSARVVPHSVSCWTLVPSPHVCHLDIALVEENTQYNVLHNCVYDRRCFTVFRHQNLQ